MGDTYWIVKITYSNYHRRWTEVERVCAPTGHTAIAIAALKSNRNHRDIERATVEEVGANE